MADSPLLPAENEFHFRARTPGQKAEDHSEKRVPSQGQSVVAVFELPIPGSPSLGALLGEAGPARPDLAPWRDEMVTRIVGAPDGSRVAAAGADGAIRIACAATGAPPDRIEPAHEGPIYSLAFSPDGRRLLTPGWDGFIGVWKAAPCAGGLGH